MQDLWRIKMLAITKKETNGKEDPIMTIQANVNLARIVKSLGRQKKWIAGKLGVSPSTVSRHLSGTLQLTLKQIEQYSHVLGVHPNSIIGVPDILVIGEADRHDDVTFRRENELRRYLTPPPNFLINAPNICAIIRSSNQGMDWKNGSILILEPDNMRNRVFDEETSLRQICVLECKTAEEVIITIGIPMFTDGEYQVLKPANPADGMRGVSIKWACPIRAAIYGAIKCGWQSIEKEE
tara:strand:+ start:1269 stop:1982 length:714 start_codon:yes stop_codon:yes gene_type:complete